VHNADPEAYRDSLTAQLPEVLARLRTPDTGFPGVISVFKSWFNKPTRTAVDIDKALRASAALDDAGLERVMLEKAMTGALFGDMIEQQNEQFRKGMERIAAELPQAREELQKLLDLSRNNGALLDEARAMLAILQKRDPSATLEMHKSQQATVRRLESLQRDINADLAAASSRVTALDITRQRLPAQHVQRIQALSATLGLVDSGSSDPASRQAVNEAVDKLPISELRRAAIRTELGLARVAVDRAFGADATTDAGELGKATSSLSGRPGQHIDTTGRLMSNSLKFQSLEAFRAWAEAHCQNTGGRNCLEIPDFSAP
jgi:hypothetical protein